MINSKKVVVVMPAYNASTTLERTYNAIPHHIVDDIILVDDHSMDDTYSLAMNLGIKHVVRHSSNFGYGGNQKTCYSKAKELDADIIVMLHPDYQYEPKLIASLTYPIAEDIFDCMLASRILGTGARKGGMPLYKYIANRILTAYQNLIIPHKLSEYHTGFRAYSRKVLDSIRYDLNHDDFIFDNEILLQIIGKGFRIGEVTCPTRYAADSSSIGVKRAIKYGFQVLYVTIVYKLEKRGLLKKRLLK